MFEVVFRGMKTTGGSFHGAGTVLVTKDLLTMAVIASNKELVANLRRKGENPSGQTADELLEGRRSLNFPSKEIDSSSAKAGTIEVSKLSENG